MLQTRLVVNRSGDPGTQVEIEVHLTAHGSLEKFVGRTIPGTFGASDYDNGMIVTRPGGRGGFVLSEHNGRFTFGSLGSPTRQMKSGVQHVFIIRGQRSSRCRLGRFEPLVERHLLQ